MTCGDHPAATVVARAAHHDRVAMRHGTAKHPACLPGQTAPGVLHHLYQQNAVLLDHQPIDFGHVRRRQCRD